MRILHLYAIYSPAWFRPSRSQTPRLTALLYGYRKGEVPAGAWMRERWAVGRW